MSQSLHLLVCFAVREEAKFFLSHRHTLPNVRVLVTGMGARNAGIGIQRALTAQSADLVLTCGFAGGLNPELPAGALVFSADAHAGLAARLHDLGGLPVRFHCAHRVATTANEKAELRRTTGADVVEMESQIIRDYCREHGIPSATLRVISDTATEDLALDFNTLMTPDMNLHFGKLAWQLVKSPGKIPALLALQQRTNTTAKLLGEALMKLCTERS